MFNITIYTEGGQFLGATKLETAEQLVNYGFDRDEVTDLVNGDSDRASFIEPPDSSFVLERGFARRAYATIEPLVIERGATVKVVRGRKVPIGTVGVVKWQGFDGYGKARVGLAVDGEAKLVYTAESNVEVVEGRPKAPAYDGPRFNRGDKVTFKGQAGEVFWSGADKYTPGRWRVGVQLANGAKVFVDAGDLVAPSAAPQTPQLAQLTRDLAIDAVQRQTDLPREAAERVVERREQRSVRDIINEVTSYRATRQ